MKKFTPKAKSFDGIKPIFFSQEEVRQIFNRIYFDACSLSEKEKKDPLSHVRLVSNAIALNTPSRTKHEHLMFALKHMRDAWEDLKDDGERVFIVYDDENEEVATRFYRCVKILDAFFERMIEDGEALSSMVVKEEEDE